MRNKSDPARQGDFDGACGFYAIGNSLSLLYPKLSTDKIFYNIFSFYINYYGDATRIINGIYRGVLNKVLQETINILELPCELYRPFWNFPASSIKEVHNTLLNYEIGVSAVAILGYEYSKDGEDDHSSHWTVLKKITAKSLWTFDSSDEYKRLPISKCRIWDNKSKHKSRPYKISSTDLFLIISSEDA